jgi:hypothetical protein
MTQVWRGRWIDEVTGVEPDGRSNAGDPIAFVVEVNADRRHLTTGSGELATELAKLVETGVIDVDEAVPSRPTRIAGPHKRVTLVSPKGSPSAVADRTSLGDRLVVS